MIKFDSETDLLEIVDFLRLDANRGLGSQKAELGQFMSPAPVARLMASMLAGNNDHIRILDAGAGVGSLFAAAVSELGRRVTKPSKITVTACEIDPHMVSYLADTMRHCKEECRHLGIAFEGEIVEGDFLETAADYIGNGLFQSMRRFNCAIINPPYKKINSGSQQRRLLKGINSDSTNIYTGFLAAVVQLLEPDGELVAITPRSFCNGTYFRSFRESFLKSIILRRLHVFETRHKAFKEDAVLQENIIVHAIKRGGNLQQSDIEVTSGADADDELPLVRTCAYSEVVKPSDPQYFIHVAADELSQHVASRIDGLECTLSDTGLTVSTGKVVDFRAKDYLRQNFQNESVPLIWVFHFKDGYIEWPKGSAKKPEFIVDAPEVANQFVPNEVYVLVKRFSAKEEKRRVVAAVYDPNRIPCQRVGFENHLNYYHMGGRGMDIFLARGLAAYLNSTLVDSYFRQFNGHTQVNATDLRNFKYPSVKQLARIGKSIGEVFPDQDKLDAILEKELGMAESSGIDPIKVKEKVDQSMDALKELGFPRQQLNERSALTLLALLGIKPNMAWKDASAPLCGITPMMDFFRDHYGKNYKPNTRETVRRQTVHQFMDAGLVVANPDRPERPVNSPKAVYQVEESALSLLRGYGSQAWAHDLALYLAKVKTLKEKYKQEREMARLPVVFPDGTVSTLSPGGQNVLVKEIVEQFAPRFASPGKFIYVGDTDEKYAFFDKEGLERLGVELNAHGKMPDVIIHFTEKNWLLLIEAVTSHGPINPKRQQELKKLFGKSKAGLVYVTTFLTRKALINYIDEISWETEVWVADSPTHMIHFNGKRFLGPYPEEDS